MVPRALHSRAFQLSLLALGLLAATASWAAPGAWVGAGFGRRRTLLAIVGAVLIVLALPGVAAFAWRKWHDAARITPLECLRVGAFCGLLTGFIEVVQQICRKFFFDIFLKLTEMLLWMAPGVHLLLFGTLGALAAVIARFVHLPRGLVLTAFVALAAWSQIILYPPMYPIAVYALTAGVGVQAARMATARWFGFTKLVRRALPVLAVMFVAALVGVPLEAHLRESRALAALPAPRPGAPNVLLVVLDTVRADHLRSHGYARDTMPHIDAALARGVTFDATFSTSSWTLPAHAAMFTGRFGHEVSADWVTALDDRWPTLAEVLSAQGYATAGFVGNLGYTSHVHGLHRGFAHYEDYYVTPAVIAWHVGISRKFFPGTVHADKVRNSAATVAGAFRSWLAEQPGDRPFFAFLNFFDAHALYLPPPTYDTKWAPRSPNLRRWYQKLNWSPEEMLGFVDAYDGLLSYIDDSFATIVADLEARGMLDDTLIVITADHGEQFGENDLTEHGNSLYRASIHVPLSFTLPQRVPAGVRVGAPVSLRDLAATVVDVLGVSPSPFPGHSLAPLWSEDPEARVVPETSVLTEISKGINTPPHVPVTKGDMKSLVEGDLHFILNGDGTGELYDMRADPREEHDLADTPAGAEIAQRMRAQLLRIE
jgi:arylsulfatase A-like enzyme